MKYHISALVLLASVLMGCGTREQAQASLPESGFTIENETVSVLPGSPLSAKLVLETIAPIPLKTTMKTTASVSPKAGCVAEVGAPFGGRVTRSFVRLGDAVRRGQPVFEISSIDYMEAVKTYFECENAARLAEANRQRKEALHEAGLLADREWEEVCAETRNAGNALEIARQSLAVFRVNPSDIQVGEPLRVTAPISGRIVQSDIVIGAYLEADAAAPVTVADLSQVWVTAHVKENQLSGLAKGGQAVIETDEAKRKEGTIFYIGELLDEKTRSVPVVMEFDNADRMLKPGMFVTALFDLEINEALLIPASAVFQGEGTKYVYVRLDDGKFAKRPVRVESLEGGRQRVLSGLSGGETIIADGGIYLSK